MLNMYNSECKVTSSLIKIHLYIKIQFYKITTENTLKGLRFTDEIIPSSSFKWKHHDVKENWIKINLSSISVPLLNNSYME